MADFIITDTALNALKAKSNSKLFGEVALALNVSVFTLPDLIRAKDARLTQMNVLKLISDTTGISINDLVEETARLENVSE